MKWNWIFNEESGNEKKKWKMTKHKLGNLCKMFFGLSNLVFLSFLLSCYLSNLTSTPANHESSIHVVKTSQDVETRRVWTLYYRQIAWLAKKEKETRKENETSSFVTAAGRRRPSPRRRQSSHRRNLLALSWSPWSSPRRHWSSPHCPWQWLTCQWASW